MEIESSEARTAPALGLRLAILGGNLMSLESGYNLGQYRSMPATIWIFATGFRPPATQ
jgi:hypothetical protein